MVKRLVALSAALCLLFLLWLSAAPLPERRPAPPEAPPSPAPSPTATRAPRIEDRGGLMAFYRGVLLEGQEFYSVTAEEYIDLSGLARAVSDDEGVAVQVLSFALVDMDRDDIPELILRLRVNYDDYYGFEILHLLEGQCLGYTVWYRALTDLKTDGSYNSSGGSDDGFGVMSFYEDAFRFTPLCNSALRRDPVGQLSRGYWLEGMEVTEEEYLSAKAAQSQKPSAQWHPLTQENIENILR